MHKARVGLENGLWLVGALMAVAHLILLATAYPALPRVIPAFVDFSGSPLFSMPKSPVAALRLPVMGLLLQAVCVVMARNSWEASEEEARNRVIWAGVSMVAAAKALLSSLDLLSVSAEAHVVFRGVLLAVSAGGVLLLLPSAYRLARTYANTPGAYVAQIGRGARMALLALLLAYAGVVVAPLLFGR